MESVLPILLFVAMAATVVVLAVGIITFAFNSKMNARHANRLMTARVALQLTAVAVLGALVLLSGA